MLKDADLIEDHHYSAKKPNIVGGIENKRIIHKINRTQGYVVYCELRGLKYGVSARLKTVSIPSFLRWAKADITKKEKGN